jgi:hypothetical protein
MVQFYTALFHVAGGDVRDGCLWLMVFLSSVLIQEIFVL